MLKLRGLMLVSALMLLGPSALAREAFRPFVAGWGYAQSASFAEAPRQFTATASPCLRLDPKKGAALWLKATVPALAQAQTLFVRAMSRPFEVRSAGTPLYSFEIKGGMPQLGFVGIPWHAVELPASSTGTELTVLTTVSDHKSGLCGEVSVGPSQDFSRKIGTDGLDRALISTFAMLAALIGIFVALATRKFSPGLWFSALSLSIAAWSFSSTSGPAFKAFIVSSSAFWLLLDLGGLFLTPVFLSGFFHQILPEDAIRSRRVLVGFAVAYAGLALVAAFGFWGFGLPPERSLRFFNQVIPVFLIGMLGLAAYHARSRLLEVRALALGIAVFLGFTVHDFLVGTPVLAWKRHLSHWGQAGMLASFLWVIWTRTRREISERDAAQAALDVNRRVAEKAKGAFHDIKTQIASMGAKIDALAEVQQDKRDALKSNLTRMRAILNLQLERVEEDQRRSDRLVKAPPASSVGGVLNVLGEDYRESSRARGVRLEFMTPQWATKVFVPLAAIDLHRVISNLIDNAMDATRPENALVLVTVERGHAGWVQVAVRDFGSGVSDKAREAFEAGRALSTKPNGHGRGLLSARMLLEEAGCKLDLQSHSDGTTAVVSLPVCERPQWLFDAGGLRAEEVFILDDDENVASRIQAQFPGLRTRLFTEESEFLVAASQSADAFLFVDYSFGGSRSGLELIQQESLSVRSVLFSGRAQFDQAILDSAVASETKVLPKEMVRLPR